MGRVAAAVLSLGLVATACAPDSEGGGPPPPRRPGATAPRTPEPPDGATPAIVVKQPVSGEEVVSPVTIAGTADVFEATVHMRVLDSGGLEVAGGFTPATGGAGLRG